MDSGFYQFIYKCLFSFQLGSNLGYHIALGKPWIVRELSGCQWRVFPGWEMVLFVFSLISLTQVL